MAVTIMATENVSLFGLAGMSMSAAPLPQTATFFQERGKEQLVAQTNSPCLEKAIEQSTKQHAASTLA
jgi:hypothetical protein